MLCARGLVVEKYRESWGEELEFGGRGWSSTDPYASLFDTRAHFPWASCALPLESWFFRVMTDWKQFQCAIVVENNIMYKWPREGGYRHQKGVHGVRGSKSEIREIGALNILCLYRSKREKFGKKRELVMIQNVDMIWFDNFLCSSERRNEDEMDQITANSISTRPGRTSSLLVNE